MSLIGNEKTKLTATFMNGMAVAMVAAGGIAPLAAFSYGLPGATTDASIAAIGIGWLLGGVTLHLLARWTLRGIRE